MNLAQLIDPERAREGFGDPRPAKPSPLPPMGRVVHLQGDDNPGSGPGAPDELMKRGRRTGRAAQVRAALGAADVTTLSMAQLVERVGGEHMPSEIHSALYGLLGNGDALQSGPRDARLYSLSTKGRAKL